MKTEDTEKLVEELMHRRILGLLGRIDGKKISDIINRMFFLQTASNERIDLIINSSGGSIGAALELCDVMTNIITVPIRGIAVGACNSAATFVMMHCDKRVCTPHAKFVVHSGTWNDLSVPINESTEEHLEHLLADCKNSTETVIKLYMKKLGKTRKEVLEMIGRGDQKFNHRLSAKEAKSFGLVETIASKKLNVF